MLKINAEKIAYHNPTRVVCDGKVLETQQLDIKTLCDLWKWYFQIPPFEKVELICETRLYNLLSQYTLSSTKSVIDLFREQGIKVVESKFNIVEKVEEDKISFTIEQLEKVKNKIESKVESIYKILDDLNIKIVGESTSRELSAYEEIVKEIDNQINELKGN